MEKIKSYEELKDLKNGTKVIKLNDSREIEVYKFSPPYKKDIVFLVNDARTQTISVINENFNNQGELFTGKINLGECGKILLRQLEESYLREKEAISSIYRD